MLITENDIWRTLLPIIRAGVAEFPDLAIKRAYQPTTQSDGDSPRVVLHRVSSKRCGAQGHTQKWRPNSEDENKDAKGLCPSRTQGRSGNAASRPTNGRIIKTEIWRKEDTYQATALVNRAPDDDGYTAVDVLEALAGHLNSDEAIYAFRNAGIGILRVNDEPETPYEDDQNSYRANVSLEFTLTYKQTKETEIPVVSATEFVTYRV